EWTCFCIGSGGRRLLAFCCSAACRQHKGASITIRGGTFKKLFRRLPKSTGWQPVLPRVACLALPALVNSAYGRTGNAAKAKPGITAGLVAPVATKPAHSPDAIARATQSGSTGHANKPSTRRVTRGSRRYRARRG